MGKIRSIILFGCFAVMASEMVVAREISREEALALEEECARQREERIAPMREQEIEKCVTQHRRDRRYCESFHRDFGEGFRNANGTWNPGLFWELPVCEDAFSAERYFKMHPRASTFTLPTR